MNTKYRERGRCGRVMWRASSSGTTYPSRCQHDDHSQREEQDEHRVDRVGVAVDLLAEETQSLHVEEERTVIGRRAHIELGTSGRTNWALRRRRKPSILELIRAARRERDAITALDPRAAGSRRGRSR